MRKAINRRVPGMGESPWTGPFTFVQLADTQIGLARTMTANGMLVRPVRSRAPECALFDLAITHINRLRPAFAIVCGDMVNEFPNPGASAARREREVRDFHRCCARVDPSIPLVCVCGNHDMGNIPNAITSKKYRDDFGDDYFTFWAQGVKCVVVNTVLWKDRAACASLR